MVPIPRTRLARLGCRRLVAWGLEIGLVAMSVAVPWGLGQYELVRDTQILSPIEKTSENLTEQRPFEQPKEDVALNPLVKLAQKGWARMAQIPPHQLHQTVPRATNILWTIALIAPVVVTGGQLIQLSCTGSTWAKRWLGIQVISTAGGYLKPRQVLMREFFRWGVSVGIGAGIMFATNISLGALTPAVIGLLAMVEGMTAFAANGRPWHDRVAKTRVTMKTAGYLPISSEPLVYSLPINNDFLSGGVLSDDALSHGNGAIQLYGETANDDDWWLTEDEGNLTSVVLAPRASRTSGNSLVLAERPKSALSGQLSWVLVCGGMVLACVAGFGFGRLTQSSAKGHLEEDVFLQTTQALSANIQSGGDYSAAILMLAQVDDPRTAKYLTDLLSQSSQPETLTTIQQALVSQGLDSLSPLLALGHVLESDLQQPLSAEIRQVRLEQRHVVQGAIAKLLTIYSNRLANAHFDRVNLGLYHDADRSFRLIQPGLLAAGTSWQGANLSQANLAGASFFDVGADGKADSFDDRISDLRGISLVAASLEKANLQGAQLANANLRRTNLTDANLVYGNLERTQLTNARLVNVNASQSHWQGSNLVGADLTQANFDKADLSQARLNRIEASHSSWKKAILTQSDWVGANLIGSDFSQATLSSANFQGANLDSVNFNRADLRQANLREADLRQTNLIGVNLTDADLAGAIFHDGSNVSGSFITPKAQVSATNHLQGVNFSHVRNLDSRQLNYICAQGGIHPSCQQVQAQEDDG
ncbi:pentapeptide repeat-containing protein [Leptothoe spongobia]|nr:pentapeptide repeat-containing protein [Leptothoe spongobia]